MWAKLDRTFKRLDVESGFSVVVRVENMNNGPYFFLQAEDRLPLMSARKGIIFR